MSRKLLIPAAGFGVRAGSPESKEMLMRPKAALLPQVPLIQLSLFCAQEARAKAHVMTRKDKISLIDYLKDKAHVQIVSETREWPETLLKSRKNWGEYNVVLMPDVDFSPTSIVSEIFKKLEGGADVVFATFSAENYHTWGVIDLSGEVARHCEKPEKWSVHAQAWGLFGFRKSSGEILLHSLLESSFDHKWRNLQGYVISLPLQRFQDLTRTT